jgi:hypothetical protein
LSEILQRHPAVSVGHQSDSIEGLSARKGPAASGYEVDHEDVTGGSRIIRLHKE